MKRFSAEGLVGRVGKSFVLRLSALASKNSSPEAYELKLRESFEELTHAIEAARGGYGENHSVAKYSSDQFKLFHCRADN